MRAGPVWAIAAKDLREVLANRMAWMPVISMPVMFAVILPLLLFALVDVRRPDKQAPPPEAIAQALASFEPAARAALLHAPVEVMLTALILGHLLAPFFLMIPLFVATGIGANAFVGEKERGTLEALLYSPATDAEIFAGKALAAFVPAVLTTWGAFALYIPVLRFASARWLPAAWFPSPPWWPLVGWLAPGVALLGVAIAVIVSARAKTFIGANQTTAALSLVTMALAGGLATGSLTLSAPTVAVLGAAIWALDFLLLWLAARVFRRERLMERL